jgi:peptidoglycan/xylan/chitin deacetylase (PgdA/CDA1 family)
MAPKTRNQTRKDNLKENRSRKEASLQPNRKNERSKKAAPKQSAAPKTGFSMTGWILVAGVVVTVAVAVMLSDKIKEMYPPAAAVVRVARSYARSRRGVGVATSTTVPTTWPSIDQTVLIQGNLLTAPIVTEAMEIVRKTVPASLLAIPPSTYISGSTVRYNSDPVANCYWPNGLCIRSAAGNGFEADVYTCPNADQWGITYDDGPTQNLVNGVHTSDTAAIRDLLDAMNIKATFFVTGSNSFQLPNEIVLSDKSGHQIASHTWSHHPLTSLTNEQIVAEIKYTETIIYRTIGKVPSYLRPPYGDTDDRVRAIANALGYRIALWDQDSGDAAGNNVNQAAVLDLMRTWYTSPRGFVSLEHDISTITSKLAVDNLRAIQALGSAFTKKIQAMATCNGHNFYSAVNGVVPGVNSTTSAAISAASTATTTGRDGVSAAMKTSTVQVTASPTPSTPKAGASRLSAISLLSALILYLAAAALL